MHYHQPIVAEDLENQKLLYSIRTPGVERKLGPLLGRHWADIPVTSCILYLKFSVQLIRYLVCFFFTLLKSFFNYEYPQDIICYILWHSV